MAEAKRDLLSYKTLSDAEALGKKYDLKALLEQQKAASKALGEYMASVERSEKYWSVKRHLIPRWLIVHVRHLFEKYR